MFFRVASATAPALLNHRDVANAENAWSGFLPTSCVHAVVEAPTFGFRAFRGQCVTSVTKSKY
jgi:hypothetical protein